MCDMEASTIQEDHVKDTEARASIKALNRRVQTGPVLPLDNLSSAYSFVHKTHSKSTTIIKLHR